MSRRLVDRHLDRGAVGPALENAILKLRGGFELLHEEVTDPVRVARDIQLAAQKCARFGGRVLLAIEVHEIVERREQRGTVRTHVGLQCTHRGPQRRFRAGGVAPKWLA